jgi:hypothetical protein
LPGLDLVELCEQLREFADPKVAAVFVRGGAHAEARSVVISPQQLELGATQTLASWLGSLDTANHVSIPSALRRPLCAFKAWTAPIATPGGIYGGVALPTVGLTTPAQRAVLRLLCDFALDFERGERRNGLLWLREGERESLTPTFGAAG